MLIQGCSPREGPLAHIQREVDDVKAVSQRRSEVSSFLGGTQQDLIRRVTEEQPWALLFCGHGHVDNGYGRPMLIFTDSSGAMTRGTDAQTLANSFKHHASLKLVVLNACETEDTATKIHCEGNGVRFGTHTS